MKIKKDIISVTESGINPYAVVLYNYLLVLSANHSVQITNKRLAEKLHWQLKTVKNYISLLNKTNLIVITGGTRSRVITLNRPDKFLSNISLFTINKSKTNTVSNIPDNEYSSLPIEKLRDKKWLLDYLVDFKPKERIKDLTAYIKERCPKRLSFGDKILLEEKGDIERTKTFDSNDFMDFMQHLQTHETRKENTMQRAGDYDLQHKDAFKKDYEQFLISNQDLEVLFAFKHRKYNSLSSCPYKLQVMFLNWIEPGLF